MSDKKNMILAVVLSALILLGWTWASNKYFAPANPPSTKVVNGKAQPVPQPQAQPVANGANALRNRAAVIGSTPRVRIETPHLLGSLNLKGAQIDDLVLRNQRQTIAKDSPPVRLLSPLGAPGAYVASFGWLGQGAPNLATMWTADGTLLSPGHPVTLSTEGADGVRYEMKIAVDDGYLFTVEQRAVNGSDKPLVLRPIGLVSRAEKSGDPSTWSVRVGPIGMFNGKADYEIKWKDLDENPAGRQFTTNGGWLGFTDKYWLAALAPAGNTSFTASLRKSPNGGYQADYAEAQSIVAAGQTLTTDTH